MAERGSGGGVSLYGSYVKGTWREGSLAGDPGV
jgi:predicted nucleotidyltransferase